MQECPRKTARHRPPLVRVSAHRGPLLPSFLFVASPSDWTWGLNVTRPKRQPRSCRSSPPPPSRPQPRASSVFPQLLGWGAANPHIINLHLSTPCTLSTGERLLSARAAFCPLRVSGKRAKTVFPVGHRGGRLWCRTRDAFAPSNH